MFFSLHRAALMRQGKGRRGAGEWNFRCPFEATELLEETGFIKEISSHPAAPFLPDALHIPLGLELRAPCYRDQLRASEALSIFH